MPEVAPRPARPSPQASTGRRSRHRRARRALAFFVLYPAAAWGLLAALATGIAPWAPWLVVGVLVYTAIPLAIVIRYRGWPFYPTRAFRVLVMRAFLYAQLLLPFLAAAGLLGLAAGAFFGEPLRAGLLATEGAGIVLLLLLVAGYLGARRLTTRDLVVHVSGLPKAFDGFRIVQISDLHVGPQTWPGYLHRVADAARSLQPDIIAITGDLVDDRHEDAGLYVAGLGRLSAPEGVFIVPGNHDVYAGWDRLAPTFARLPSTRLLVNEAHVLRRGPDALVIAGTGDPAGRGFPEADVAPDIERTLADVPPGTPVVALAHNPVLWPALAERGVQLTLSGHTHWGQLAIPALRWSLVTPFVEHAMGVYQDGGATLFVHPGTGFWGVPFRLGAPPEVTRITLRPTVSMVTPEGDPA
ncbi:MAG: metallophosphoesterase [Gemmatimonadota bacterium]